MWIFTYIQQIAFYRIPMNARPRDLRPDLYVAFVEEDGEEADGEDQRPRPDAQGHRQVHTHFLQDTQTLHVIKPSFSWKWAFVPQLSK